MARPTFLMAEPEPQQALSARKLVLETAKFNVITAHSSREALELCEKFPNVDALIVHGNMEDCERVVAELKKCNQEVPTIVLSPSASRTCQGAHHHVSSHSPEDLLSLLRNLFGDPRQIDGR